MDHAAGLGRSMADGGPSDARAGAGQVVLREWPAFAYMTTCGGSQPGAEIELRRMLVEYAGLEGLDLRSLFVDNLGESPYGFAAMRELLRRAPDVRTVVLPDLTHVAHLPVVAHLGQAGLARFLGARILLVNCPRSPSASSPVSIRRGPSGARS